MNKRVYIALRKVANNGQQPAQTPKTPPTISEQLTQDMKSTLLGGGLGLAFGKVRQPAVTQQDRANRDKIMDLYRRIYSLPAPATRPTYPDVNSMSPMIRHKPIRPSDVK